jgi:5'-nucleotidase
MTEPAHTPPPRALGVFCNRTLNMRSIKAIGYDMDYTLIHYHVDVWEARAYEHTRDRLAAKGWPVEHLRFEPEQVVRALIIDTELGNLVKSDRFGYVKVAAHGTRGLDFGELREAYGRTIVDLRDARWEFLNTLFSISIGCLFSQCVDLLDARALPAGLGYRELYHEVQRALDLTHLEGELKREIMSHPGRFVEPDPALLTTLVDQRDAGKKLLLITNSEWHYTDTMLRWYFQEQLGWSGSWTELFDLVIVQARKPDFFLARAPMYEVIDAAGNLRPLGPTERPEVRGGANGTPAGPGGTRSSGASSGSRCYFGGSAALVEKALGVQGQDILYVGDHIFADVHASKRTVRWRTALVLREIEADIAATDAFTAQNDVLAGRMQQKTALERELADLRLTAQRLQFGRLGPDSGLTAQGLEPRIAELRRELADLDQLIAPLAEESARLPHPRWGAIMRAGLDKSHLARQIERYADIYLSRVSNLGVATPFAYFRPPRISLPHDA